MLLLRWSIACALVSSTPAREITFPPAIGVMSQQILDHGGNIDVTAGPVFAGLTTYANLPYVHCLAGDDEVEKYDIAILGAPFDTVSTDFLVFPTGYRDLAQVYQATRTIFPTDGGPSCTVCIYASEHDSMQPHLRLQN